MTTSFPKDFLWGAASAAHQVEGGNDRNQWWAFEQIPGTIKNGDKSGSACDHYRRYAEDFRILKKLGHNAHRISLEWSRFFPDSPATLNREAVTHYHRVIDMLIRLKLEPFVTTFHFTLPLWFAERGGFERRENLKYYNDFVSFIAREYKGKVRFWNTINEPTVYTLQSYFTSEFPPARVSLPKAISVLRNLIHAHASCYHILKDEDSSCKAGLVHHCMYMEPRNRNNPLDRIAAAFADWMLNGSFIDALRTGTIRPPIGLEHDKSIQGTSDFIGLNYYTRKYVSITNIAGTYTKTGSERVTQMGWTEYPGGLYHFIQKIHRALNVPIYITENGIATDDETWRADFIRRHIAEAARARNDGADVRGYFYWSNLDNFEWAHGFGPHFGIIGVDRKTGKRSVKKGARAYADIIAKNGI